MLLTAACSRSTSVHGPRVLVGDIARVSGAALRQNCVLSPEQHRVLRAIECCRTAALGGHLHVCGSCGYAVPVYNSCRNRHCPRCQSLEQQRWLERRRERILPVPYFHVVFTLPAELRPIVLLQRERLFTILMQAASQTLLTLAQDDKRLGATPAKLSHVEFLRWLLLHVLPKGFHKIRHYGLSSAPHVRLGSLERACSLIAPGSTRAKALAEANGGAPQTWLECLLSLTGTDIVRCPRCETGMMTRQPLNADKRPALHDTS